MGTTLNKKIKLPILPKNHREIDNFFKSKGLKDLLLLSKGVDPSVNEMILKSPYKPELYDLFRLYKFVTLNKRTTILEFGSGWSSLIFYIALSENKKKFSNKLKNLRRNNPFELFVLENEKKYFNITKKRVSKFKNKILSKNQAKINWMYSEVEMTKFQDRYATQYKSLPLCNPDFIYLDGPNQFNIKNKINNFTTAHKDMMPMVCDILKIEYFLTPGTIIVTDGRSANAQFLKEYFKRNWLYNYDQYFDQHIFYLNAPCLGQYNKLQLEFYNS